METLDLSDTRISDEGVKQLANCPLLQTLKVENTLVTGECFAELTSLKKLIELAVSRNLGDTRWYGSLQLATSITDSGLSRITELTWNERINLNCFSCDSPLSKEGLRELLKLEHATRFEVYGLSLSRRLETLLRKRFPDLELVR